MRLKPPNPLLYVPVIIALLWVLFTNPVWGETVKHPVEECATLANAWGKHIESGDYTPRVDLVLSSEGRRVYMYWLDVIAANEPNVVRPLDPELVRSWIAYTAGACLAGNGEANLPDEPETIRSLPPSSQL